MSAKGKFYYTLFEKHSVKGDNILVECFLFRSSDPNALGDRVPLSVLYPDMADTFTYAMDTPIITGYLRLKMPILRCFSKRASQMNVMLFCVLWTIPTQQEEPMRKGRFNEFMRTHIFSHFNKT